MTKENFKYDVAFSFLQQDETIALQLADLLEGRFKAFVYSEKQAELAGKDGEKILNLVFGEEARVVVVLYRNDWGKTKWTRIEMTAIKNRAYDNGYDFSLFMPLGDNIILPKWFPKTQIWYNFDRWGLEAAVSIIELKIQQEGGNETKESTIDKAERINRTIETKKKKEEFLNSVQGVKAANAQIPVLFDEIEKIVKEIEGKTQNIKIGVNRDRDGRAITLYSGGHGLHVEWYGKYNNTLSDSYLYYGLLRRSSVFDNRNEEVIFKCQLRFDVTVSNEFGWFNLSDDKFFNPRQLAELCVETILEKIKNSD